MQKHNDHQKRFRERQNAKGLCKSCNNPVIPGHKSCAIHLAKNAAYTKIRSRKRIANNLCVYCGKPKIDGTSTICRECYKRYKEGHRQSKESKQRIRKERKALGLCRECGNVLDTSKTECSECIQKRVARSRRYRFNGNWEKAMERDNNTCQICGETSGIQVHHIDGNGTTNTIVNHALDNLIVLCAGCHCAITRFRSKKRNIDLVVRLILS
jgi:5-methylcytosine-specific restriction endonuclease McrA